MAPSLTWGSDVYTIRVTREHDMNKKKRKEIERLSADHERWDTGELGRSEEHMRILSDEEEKDIDDGLGLQHISLRLNKNLIEQLKGLAKLEGIGYQPLIRQVLTKYTKANEHKLDRSLSAAEAAQRADGLFVQAIKLREEILALPQLSHQKIVAETDYTRTLGQAQSLFVQAYDTTADVVVKRHAKLRMGQIADLCQAEPQAEHDRDRGKKRKAV
jgi:hypothetical protein